MGDTGPMKLQLEVVSGWSELFAVLQTLLAPSR